MYLVRGGAIICPGVTIGERSVIGAGSVITRDIPSDVIASGNPARAIRALPSRSTGGSLSDADSKMQIRRKKVLVRMPTTLRFVVRCLDDVDLEKMNLEIKRFDGRNWEEAIKSFKP